MKTTQSEMPQTIGVFGMRFLMQVKVS